MTDKNATTEKGSTKGASEGLGLVVPVQGPAPADSMLLEPRETSEWIASLPLANIGETARQVYTTLVGFNRFEIPDVTRAKVVELFRPTVEYVCHNLRRHYIDIGFPLSKKAWKTAILATELNNELATSYKIIVERMLAERAERFDRKLLVISLHHALHYLSRVYLQTTLAYRSPDAMLWKQANAIFAFARQNQIHRVPVKMKQGKENDQVSTIEEIYKGLMLFATTIPSRLRQSHLESTFAKTREWTSHTHFLGSNDDIPTASAINVKLGSDEAPVHNALRMPIAGRYVAILDLRPLIRKLHEEYEQAPIDGCGTLQSIGRNLLPRGLLRQLIRNWHMPAERQFVRTRLHFSLRVLVGLRPIHAALLPETDRLTPAAGNAPLTGVTASPNINVPAISEPRGVDPLSVIDDSQLSLAPDDPGHPAADTEPVFSQLAGNDTASPHWQDSQTLDPTDPRGLEVTTLNESAGGYCIPWPGDSHPPKVKVGELLGIGGGEGGSYTVAVIRWLHSIDQEQLELGVQILSNQVDAMNASLAPRDDTKPSGRKVESVPCLVLDLYETQSETQEPSILLSSASYPVGTELLLDRLPTQKRRVRLTRLIDFSSGFARFGIEFPDQDDQQKEKDAQPGYTDFDSLWNTL
ncbi:MAG: hypothetical protein D6720_12015 [Gammaproteobacteria bacterium]|nr:MAG: hypothetical protein D6720_12015 [Gammaproteobacteria bacterium]